MTAAAIVLPSAGISANSVLSPVPPRFAEAPVGIDEVAELDRGGDLANALQRRIGKDEIVPGMDGLHFDGELAEGWPD